MEVAFVIPALPSPSAKALRVETAIHAIMATVFLKSLFIYNLIFNVNKTLFQTNRRKLSSCGFVLATTMSFLGST